MATYKLAELLLRRKELMQKVAQLQPIQRADLFELKIARKPAHEGIDDIRAEVPKLTASQVTAEYDYYAHLLRLTDAEIQKANWTTEVKVDADLMSPYQAPK